MIFGGLYPWHACTETICIVNSKIALVFETMKCLIELRTKDLFVSSFSFLFVNDQIASFQLKKIFVFSKCPLCVFKLISLPDCNRVWLLNYNRFVLSGACSWKHEPQQKKELSNSVSCRHFLRIFLYLPIENRVLLSAWIKAKDSDVTRRHLRSKVFQKTSLDGSFLRRCFKRLRIFKMPIQI